MTERAGQLTCHFYEVICLLAFFPSLITFIVFVLKVSDVGFVVKIEEVKAQEREDVLFECVLTHPVSSITWMGNGNIIQDGGKYSASVSDHKLIHRLIVRDCLQGDRGIYSAVVGKRTCSAWLLVEGKPTHCTATVLSLW